MERMNRHDRSLYIAVWAAVQAAVVNKGRAKPQLAAAVAKQHAQAAVVEAKRKN
jgi:hypothetical protein